MLSTHSDDKGLVLPPMVAPVQLVIVPIFDARTKKMVLTEAGKLAKKIEGRIRVKVDDRDHLTPGRKFNEWELKGVPLRVEVGPRDLKQRQVVLARRDTLSKRAVKMANFEKEVTKELIDIQESLFARASGFLKKNTHRVETYDELKSVFLKGGGIVQAPWCGSADCEAAVRRETEAKIINIPLNQRQLKAKCVYCGNEAKSLANFARSY
jgi:prolyl-tRNA synthetase